MKYKACKLIFFAALAASTVLLGGCRSNRNSAGMYGGDNLYGDPLINDVPLADSNMGLAVNADRSMFAPVMFAYDSSQVNPEEVGKVEAVAGYLKKGKAQGVIVEGHADERGSREYNLALGERRALAIRDYLINLGVDPAIIQTKSYGEEMPEAMGHDEESWRQNRRGVFGIY